MARESAVDQLSPEHLELLKVRLEDSGFQDYQQLTDWLTELGYQISKSSVHRFGKKHEHRSHRAFKIIAFSEKMNIEFETFPVTTVRSSCTPSNTFSQRTTLSPNKN